jgi:hypothetical protein
MKNSSLTSSGAGQPPGKKILLTILPYWSPIIPPAGIAALKSFLQPRGYRIKAVDTIAKKESLEFYYEYFDIVKKYVPPEKRGNFYNNGHDLLQNHMMAHIHYKDEKAYIELMKQAVYNHYFVNVGSDCIVELNRLLDNFYERLRRYFLFLLGFEKPDVLGITVYKTTLPASLFVLRLAREKYPHIKTVIGGGIFADSHAVGTPNFHRLLEVTGPYLDKIFIGEGELLFLEYLRGRLPQSRRVYSIADLQGERLEFEDIDTPDFTDFNVYKYGYLPATASVSCPFQCTFCNEINYWGKFRKKRAGRVVSEMIALKEKYNRQLFFMTDSLLNPVVTDLAREIIRRKAVLYYDAYFRVDDASADVRSTSLWRQGGLYRVRLGIESGSQRMLDKMGKGITVKQIKAALSSLAYAGIKTTTYWVMGHPGETEDDFQATLALIEELKDYIWQAECNPFRYFFSGHNSSGEWDRHRVALYGETAKEMFIFDECVLNVEPSREVIYDRMNRFVQHCKKLGIPNPYSTYESCEADKRWQQLHKNAAPPMLEFMGVESEIDESKYMKPVSLAVNTREDENGFDF